MFIPPWVYAAIDGFTLGGLLSTGRPSAPTTLFPEEGHEWDSVQRFTEITRPFRDAVKQRLYEKHQDDAFMQQLYDKAKLRREAEKRGLITAGSSATRRSRSRAHAG